MPTPKQLEQLWADHLSGEFEDKDVEATLATMVDDAYVNHMPVNTGGRGKDALRAFYRDDFIPSWPSDLQMAPLALPGMVVGDNRFTYTDDSPGPRRVRVSHDWVERSASRPPDAPPAPVFPADGGRTDGTDIVFQWRPPQDAGGDGVADYHFEL